MYIIYMHLHIHVGIKYEYKQSCMGMVSGKVDQKPVAN